MLTWESDQKKLGQVSIDGNIAGSISLTSSEDETSFFYGISGQALCHYQVRKQYHPSY
jgi:hypothetical protein